VTTDEIGDQLTRWGTVATIETVGRRTRQPATAAIGYVEEDDGSLLVAAGDPSADWARNLELEPACTVTVGDLSGRYLAQALDGPERNAAIAALILRYGTPAEGLGRGPTFRLRPAGRPA
jgi:deazaflavin-dependent oxidoreductase (nitroreductase family)